MLRNQRRLLNTANMFVGEKMNVQVDFNSFSWHTLFLLGGGNVLGKAISSSQLLDYLAHGIVRLLPKVRVCVCVRVSCVCVAARVDVRV